MSPEELPHSKCKCFGCGAIFDRAIRPQYEEISVANASQLCGVCFQKQVNIERENWKVEQRKIHGPGWDRCLTIKKFNFKKPISLPESSGSVTSKASSAALSSEPTTAPKKSTSGWIQ